MKHKIRIGTRGSKLALWQAYYVADLLQKGGMDTEIVTIETKGDKILDVSISKIGSKGVFTEEIEDQLKAGNIDIAVHSAKDLQSELPSEFEILAFTERERANDVYLSNNKNLDTEDKNLSLVIGTSSTRRIAMLRHYFPHLKTVEMRGNLQTRISKMEAGACDILLLAYAGVHRMKYSDMILKILPTESFTPAVGQGSIAVECAIDLGEEKKKLIKRSVNHAETEIKLIAERAYLKKLQGGCSIPVFAMAEYKDEILSLSGGIVSLDGQNMIRKTVSGRAEEASELGQKLGNNILDEGGREILHAIKNHSQSKTFYI
ncbi:hydroxymethylbilane synthase [soil metagenome]